MEEEKVITESEHKAAFKLIINVDSMEMLDSPHLRQLQ